MITLLYTLITSTATGAGGMLPLFTRLRKLEQRHFD